MKLVRIALFLLATMLVACQPGGPGADAIPTVELDEQDVKAVENRQAVYKLLRHNFVPLAQMAQEKAPYDAAVAQKHADRMPVLIGMIEEMFERDTRDSGVTTEALDVIWEDVPGFKKKITAAGEAARNLQAKASDPDQFTDATWGMGKACGGCHDDFRVDDD